MGQTDPSQARYPHSCVPNADGIAAPFAGSFLDPYTLEDIRKPNSGLYGTQSCRKLGSQAPRFPDRRHATRENRQSSKQPVLEPPYR